MFFLFIKESYLKKKYWGFVHKRDASVKTHSSTFSIFMASGVLWKQALKLDSLTGYEITDSQGEEEVKKK